MTETSRPIFAMALKSAIAATGKSGRELAAELGIPYSTFRKWLCGVQMPFLTRVTALVRATGDTSIFEAYLQESDMQLAKRSRAARRRLELERQEKER